MAKIDLDRLREALEAPRCSFKHQFRRIDPADAGRSQLGCRQPGEFARPKTDFEIGLGIDWPKLVDHPAVVRRSHPLHEEPEDAATEAVGQHWLWRGRRRLLLH